jgi:uncharacterized protein YjbI with pentapeptide repeats
VRNRRLFRSFRAQKKYPDLTRGDVPSSLAPGFHIAAPLALRANLTGVDLTGANLEGTNLNDVKIDERVAEQIRDFQAKQTRP